MLKVSHFSKSRSTLLAAGLLGALSLGACGDTGWGDKQTGGTAVGAGGGAVLGAAVGGWQGAAIGAVAGGVVGNLVGKDMDENERRRAEDATWRSARDGRRSEWSYEGRGRGYSEPAGDFYTRDGVQCREFDQYYERAGRDYRDRVTICRKADGSWSRV
jgi:surface antigen